MRRLVVALAIAMVVLLGGDCGQFVRFVDAEDPLLSFDWRDALTGLIVEIGPGVPLILPGPDGELDSNDDEILLTIVGDVDLVVRSGLSGFGGALRLGPLPAAIRNCPQLA